jgi:hypothetical protein
MDIRRLIRSITTRLFGAGYFASSDNTSTVGLSPDALEHGMSTLLKMELGSDRMDVYRDMDEIDDTMPEGSRALDVLADNAVNAEGGGLHAFVVSYEGDVSPAVQQVVDGMIARTRLKEKAYAIARETAKYGDNFQQVIVSDRGIERLMFMSPYSMMRNEDIHGLLMTGDDEGKWAFEQHEIGGGRFIAGFYPWQIQHLRWNRSGGSKYGRPQLLSARPAWKKLQAMQEALVINWLTRAFVRLVFELDTTGKKPAEAQQYIRSFMQEMQKRMITLGDSGTEQMSVPRDIAIGNGYMPLQGKYMPTLNKVTTLDTSNSGFWNISAIEYWRNKFISATGVPKAHLGLEADINAKSTLQWQDERFSRTVRRIQSMLSEFIAHLIDLELLLVGLDPRSVPYKIEWAPPSMLDMLERAQALNYVAQATDKLLAHKVVDVRWLRENALRMTPTQAKDLDDA